VAAVSFAASSSRVCPAGVTSFATLLSGMLDVSMKKVPPVSRFSICSSSASDLDGPRHHRALVNLRVGGREQQSRALHALAFWNSQLIYGICRSPRQTSYSHHSEWAP